jgi:4a-hydroxytetrahydrobiopterin dehydratase
MTERIDARQFSSAGGVGDWRVVTGGGRAGSRWRTGSFAAGVELVRAIGELADTANHHPDVDLRYATVTVWLTTHEVSGLSDRDIALARKISVAARELGATAEPPGE